MASNPTSFTRFHSAMLAGIVPASSQRVTSVTKLRAVPSRRPAPRPTSLLALPQEPEDARLTGGTRSLQRRLLALNLSFPRKATTVPQRLLPALRPTAA
jgi:hypothetical protein